MARAIGSLTSKISVFVRTNRSGSLRWKAETVYDVADIIAIDAIEVEVGGIQLGSHGEPSLFVPYKRLTIFAQLTSERSHIPCRIHQLPDSVLDPT